MTEGFVSAARLGKEPGLMESDGSLEWPKVYVKLQIDLRLMTEEQRQSLDEAVSLLRKAGLSFDRGIGGGFYDIELDWSLHGAITTVRPIHCMKCRRKNFSPVFWTVYRRLMDGGTLNDSFCSAKCQAEDEKEAVARQVFHEDERGVVDHEECKGKVLYEGPWCEVIVRDRAPAHVFKDIPE